MMSWTAYLITFWLVNISIVIIIQHAMKALNGFKINFVLQTRFVSILTVCGENRKQTGHINNILKYQQVSILQDVLKHNSKTLTQYNYSALNSLNFIQDSLKNGF